MMIFPNHTSENKLHDLTIDNWGEFKRLYPSFDTAYYNKVVNSVLKCSDPSYGFRQYMCLSCGEDSKVVAFSCKSKFCLRCGRVNGEKFSLSIKERLHPDVAYRHLILTIPEQTRSIFFQNRSEGELFGRFFSAGWKCVQDFVAKAAGHALECGCLIVLHTVGRSGEYKPHLHILLMGGGVNSATGKWEVLDKFPYQILHQSWKKCLLKMFRDWDVDGKYRELFSFLDSRYQKGFVARIEAGSLPKASKHLIRYLSKYLCRPQISQKRIRRYDAKHGEVDFEYLSHRTKKVEIETMSAINFLGRLVQQILPKGFQRIRYYGLQASKNSNRLKKVVSEAVGNFYLPDFESNEAVEAETEELTKNLNYRDLVKLWWGTDPLQCRKCGEIMELVRVWKPGKGFVFSIFKHLFGKDIGPPGNLPDICFKIIETPELSQATMG